MLTDPEARQAKAREKDYKLPDGGGLYLFVATTGRQTWRLKYRHGGKEKRLVLGAYPDMNITTARARRDEAKAHLREGRDPALEATSRPMPTISSAPCDRSQMLVSPSAICRFRTSR